MPIRPIDVRRKEFKNSFRGYDANQVDDFLDAVADEFERSYTENSRMREEISSLRERLQQFEELEGSIRAALVHAEQAASDLRRTATQEAEDLRLSANREAEHLRKSAAQEAEFTIREAKARSHQMLADTSERVERIQKSYEAIQEAKRNFMNDFRHLLKSYMEVMDNVEVASAKEIEASLRERLDTESIAVAREAASHDDRTERAAAEQTSLEQEEAELADLEREVEGTEEERPEPQGPLAAEDPGVTQRLEPEPTSPAPEPYETETQEPEMEPSTVVQPSPEMEPSTAQGSDWVETAPSEPAVEQPAGEVEREEVEREEPSLAEEHSLAEESRSHEFFDRDQDQDQDQDRDQGASPEQDRRDSRIFRASRFLRRRE
jgi:cell division initiation protein